MRATGQGMLVIPLPVHETLRLIGLLEAGAAHLVPWQPAVTSHQASLGGLTDKQAGIVSITDPWLWHLHADVLLRPGQICPGRCVFAEYRHDSLRWHVSFKRTRVAIWPWMSSSVIAALCCWKAPRRARSTCRK